MVHFQYFAFLLVESFSIGKVFYPDNPDMVEGGCHAPAGRNSQTLIPQRVRNCSVLKNLSPDYMGITIL